MPAGIGSAGYQGSFWQLLTEDTPVAPLLPKLLCKPKTSPKATAEQS